MRRIVKGEEPPSLTAHREGRTAPAADGEAATTPSWSNYLQTDDARWCVRQEQRQLCAFCQGSIEHGKRGIKLAHVVPQRGTELGNDLQLRWSNIVGVCLGGQETNRTRILHCDSLQGNRPLSPQLDPVQFVNGSLYYNSDGEIHSLDPAVEHQLEHVRGLNRKPVLRKRLDAFDGEEGIKNLVYDSPAPAQKRRELIALLDPDNPSDAPLLEYADFLLWHLRYGKLSALAKVSQMGNGLP